MWFIAYQLQHKLHLIILGLPPQIFRKIGKFGAYALEVATQYSATVYYET